MPGDTTTTDTEDFFAVLSLPTSPETVLGFFTSAAGVCRWWGPTEGDGNVGGVLVTSFGEHGSNAMRVVESGPARVVWKPIAPAGASATGHTQEWLDTRVEIEVSPASAGAELRFRHVGLTRQLECWEPCVAAWTYFMSSIKALATTGSGTPFGA
jgi:hypothetical protein